MSLDAWGSIEDDPRQRVILFREAGRVGGSLFPLKIRVSPMVRESSFYSESIDCVLTA